VAINIACYVQQIQLLTSIALSESEKRLHRTDQLSDEARLNILTRGVMTLAKGLEEEIYREVKQRENTSYSYGSNEMNMFAMAAILAAWSGWVFKSKSEDPNRAVESREQAAAINKYTGSFILNAIIAGQRMGEGGGIPEGKSQLIEVS
jgi:hypothetical protein